MKNTLKILVLVLVLVICLASCDNNQAHLDTINGLLQNGYESYSLTVIVESDIHKVTEEYTVRTENGEKSVDYRIEEINSFEITDDGITAPDEYITVKEGTLSASEIYSTDFSVPSFNFSTGSLKNIGYNNGVLTANVISLSSFMGLAENATNANIAVSFNEQAIEYIMICYTSEAGNNVTITYAFN